MKEYKLKEDFAIQIDVKEIGDRFVTCNMYTGVLCPQVVIKREDYDYLVHKGFFLRKEAMEDQTGILNTTDTYRVPLVSVTG